VSIGSISQFVGHHESRREGISTMDCSDLRVYLVSWRRLSAEEECSSRGVWKTLKAIRQRDAVADVRCCGILESGFRS
jgi:hypothetical protein